MDGFFTNISRCFTVEFTFFNTYSFVIFVNVYFC